MLSELQETTRPISQLSWEELDSERIQRGLETLDEVMDALGALNAAYRDQEWDALCEYDERVMAVVEPLTRAAVLLNVHQL